MQLISAHCSILSREIPYSSQSRIPWSMGNGGSHVLGGSSGYLLHSQDTHNHFAATDLQIFRLHKSSSRERKCEAWLNMFGNQFLHLENKDYGPMAAELHQLSKLRHLRPSQLRVVIWSLLIPFGLRIQQGIDANTSQSFQLQPKTCMPRSYW